jgi:para-aminobenzoate synthetase
VHIIKNDDLSLKQLIPVLSHLSAVVVGPGPGSPDCPSDVGVIADLWTLSDADLLPIFGVCLGLQSLALSFGARLKRLNVVKHGQVSPLNHDGTGLFKGVTDALVVRYHSLHVKLESGGTIEELASAEDKSDNGHVVMAIRHLSKPFWAVQYHPESACTQGGGVDVLRNFWCLAKTWCALNGRAQAHWQPQLERIVGPPWPSLATPKYIPSLHSLRGVEFATLYLPGFSITNACENLGVRDESSPFVLLHSAAHPGRVSIIGCIDIDTPRISFTVGHSHADVRLGSQCTRQPLGPGGIWSWLASFMHSRRAHGGLPEVPFWGGFIGYLSYELGTSELSPMLSPRKERRRHPDVNLVFVERSIVFDRHTQTVYVQTIRPNDTAWLSHAQSLLTNSSGVDDRFDIPPAVFSSSPSVRLPDEDLYKACIEAAKERLFAGDSYELCLTASTHITIQPSIRSPPSSSSWELYKNLQSKNPAPHSGYLRLHPSTLLSSSPERFLSFSRPPDSRCQLRPIKGTVQKAPGITREMAERLLAGSNKEVAENLMIVDLIRHDLHGVVGDDVVVKEFCCVEEYETVWQLTSVIEGGLSSAALYQAKEDLGWRVLQHSLPPGKSTVNPLYTCHAEPGLREHDGCPQEA